jgi:MFS family permease
LRGALGTDLPHSQLRDRSRRAGNGCRDRVRRGGRRIAERPLIGGLAADRIGAKRMIVFGLALQAISVSLYVFTRDLAGFYGLALMFGFSYGAVMQLYAIPVREYFGPRIMGTMFGAVNMASTLGMAIGPWAGGWLYDVYGSYFWLYIGSFGIGIGAAAIAFSPPRDFSLTLSSPGGRDFLP